MTGDRRPRSYNSVAIAFHWASTAVILVALPLGFLAAHASDSRQATPLLRIHIPLGILALVLTVARAIWRYRHAPPPPPSDQPLWQTRVARVSHALLYVVPVVLGASGLALLAMSGAAPILFARMPGALPDFSRFAPMAVHALGAIVLIGLLTLHVAAVLYHQVYRRDQLLARMGIGSRSRPTR